jgi:hypothetical protein
LGHFRLLFRNNSQARIIVFAEANYRDTLQASHLGARDKAAGASIGWHKVRRDR